MPRRFPDDEGFDKVNFIIDSWTTGCDAPWYIYVETMKPAALEAFLVLLSFGWADVIRGRFRPKGLGHRTSKRKGRWNRRIPSFPELGNTIGKNLPFGEQLDDFVKWQTPTKFLWRIDTLMQAGLFWWLVADVAEDFVFNWTSLLYESYWCQPDPPGRFSYTCGWGQTAHFNNWQHLFYFQKDYEVSPPYWSGGTCSAGPNGCSFAATISFREGSLADPSTNYELRIVDAVSGAVLAETGDLIPDPSGTTRAPLLARVGTNRSLKVEARGNGARTLLGDGVVVGFGNPAA